MVKSSDFQIASIQATLFTPGLRFVPSKFLGTVLEKWGTHFDDTPVSLPAPPDLPPEIPRVTLQSANKQQKLELAPARANLFWLRRSDEDRIDLKDFLDFSADILCDYVDIVGGRVGRIAAVLNRFLGVENPGLLLGQHFCKEKWQTGPFNRPESFEIHAHKRYGFDRYTINSWVRCKTGTAGKGPDQKSIILVEQDINTIAEEAETKEFSEEEIKDFFRLVPAEFDAVLSLYFPSEG